MHFIFSLTIFTVHYVTRGRGVLKSGVCGFLFWVISGYFWHGHVLSSESIKTMFHNSDLLDTLADVRPNCAMLESLIIRS